MQFFLLAVAVCYVQYFSIKWTWKSRQFQLELCFVPVVCTKLTLNNKLFTVRPEGLRDEIYTIDVKERGTKKSTNLKKSIRSEKRDEKRESQIMKSVFELKVDSEIGRQKWISYFIFLHWPLPKKWNMSSKLIAFHTFFSISTIFFCVFENSCSNISSIGKNHCWNSDKKNLSELLI